MMGAPESLPSALDRVYKSLSGAGLAIDPAAADPASTAPPGSPAAATEPWAALEHLAALFHLTRFERDVLVLLVGHSMEARFGATPPTFALALAALDDPHWTALSSARPLRYWQLVSVDPGSPLHAPLRLDERILAYLIGMPAIDERLRPLIAPLDVMTAQARPADHAAVLAGARHWSSPAATTEPLLLVGPTRSVRERALAAICDRCQLVPYGIDAADIPHSAADREHLARLWTREAALRDSALYVRTEHSPASDADAIAHVPSFLRMLSAPVAIEAAPGSSAERLDGIRLHLSAMSTAERRQLWAAALGPLAGRVGGGHLDRVAEYFQLDEPGIRQCAAIITAQAAEEAAKGTPEDTAGDTPDASASLGPLAWRTCREHARRGLQALATRVEPSATWDSLVLPPAQLDSLRQLILHVRHRAVVNDEWGFAARHGRGVGLTALFAGASGTGKTMAAEVIAAELDLDLYKIDLATVVSKYIGETEKNLREIFSAAEQSGAILLFDEADALFGKRSEVRDSHDRYANLEVSYLLQQMEAYQGVAILTTNMQHALDTAFTRRLRFIVQFPFPDAAARELIWRGIFPAATPVADLDFAGLALLTVAGGVIRNIATLAAFQAAGDGGRIEARHILAAVRTEYAKTGKPLTAAELRGLNDRSTEREPERGRESAGIVPDRYPAGDLA